MARPEVFMSGAPDEVSSKEIIPHIPTPEEELHSLVANFVGDFNSKLNQATHIKNVHSEDGKTATVSFIDKITTNKFVRTNSLLVPPPQMPENVTPIDQPESFTQYEVNLVDHPSVYIKVRLAQSKGKGQNIEVESRNYAGETTKVDSSNIDTAHITTVQDDLMTLTEQLR